MTYCPAWCDHQQLVHQTLVSPNWKYFFKSTRKAYKTNCWTSALEGKHWCRHRQQEGGEENERYEEPLLFTRNSVILACWAETPAAVWCSEAAESPRAACDGDNDSPHWDYYTAVSSLCTRPIKYAWTFEMNFGGWAAHPQLLQHQQPLLLPPLLAIVKLYNHIPVY